MSKLERKRADVPVLGIVKTRFDAAMTLSPLELGETQIVEEQVMMVFVQVEVGLKQGQVFKLQACNSTSTINFIFYFPTQTHHFECGLPRPLDY